MMADGLTAAQAARLLQVNITTLYTELRAVGLRYRGAAQKCEECGLQVTGTARARHLVSVYHRRARRIRALLSQDCLSFSQIGKRVGVTRERVRKIAGHLKVSDGRYRQSVCAITRIEADERRLPANLPEGLKRRLQRFNDIRTPRTCCRPGGLKSRAAANRTTINGKPVIFFCANPRPNGTREQYMFNPVRRDADYTVFYLKDIDVAYVVPRDAMPPKTVSIPAPGTRRYKNSRNWEQYKERWDLLEIATRR